MKSFRIASLAALTLLVVVAAGCQEVPDVAEPAAPEEPAAVSAADTGLVEVVLADYSFTAPPTLRSGWNTFRMTNNGEEPHFMVAWKLPEGVVFGDYAENVAATFGREYARFVAGEIDADGLMAAIGGNLPEWFGGVDGAGAVGLVSAGVTAETTVHLEPGEYVLECYVKSADGEFHGELGMMRPLIVTEDDTGREAPAADVEITLSNYSLAVTGNFTAGEQVVAVNATEVPEGLVGHDVHLARLAPDASVDDLVAWMNWVGSLQSPAPAEFLGGADEVAPGRTSYVHVNLEPGRYVWISEGYGAAGIVHEFEIE